MTIRLVLVDVDGTVVESEPRNRRAIEDVAKKGGHYIQPQDWNTLAGQGDGVIFEQLAAIKPELRTVFNGAAGFELACVFAKLEHINDVKKINETAEALALFRENALDIVPVSNSVTADAGASLKHAGYDVENDFTFHLFRDEFEALGLRSKPYPDPYLEALRRANEIMAARSSVKGETFIPVNADECLILEDSKTGARAGLSAGMHVIQMIDESPALDENEALEMIETHNSVYKPMSRAELVPYCRTLVNGPC